MLRAISTFALATALAATTFAPAAANTTTREEKLSVTTSSAATDIKPPVAAKRPHTYTHHGITIEDPYDWLYDKSLSLIHI